MILKDHASKANQLGLVKQPKWVEPTGIQVITLWKILYMLLSQTADFKIANNTFQDLHIPTVHVYISYD